MKINKLAKQCAFILLVFVLCYLTDTIQNKILKQPDLQGDFLTFFQAGKAASINKNIYDYKILDSLQSPEVRNKSSKYFEHVWPYLYTPFLGYSLIPINKLCYDNVKILWKQLNMLIFLISLLLSFFIAKKYNEDTNLQYMNVVHKILPFIILLLIIILPFQENIFQGQVNIIVTFFISLSILLYLYKRDILSGVSLSIAILLKSSPVILILYFIAIKRIKVVYGAILGGLIILAYTLFLGAYNNWYNYICFLPNMSYGHQIPGLPRMSVLNSFSFASYFGRMFVVQDPMSKIMPILAFIGILLFLLYKTYKYRNSKNIPLFIILYIILFSLGSPICFSHHLILILPCVPLMFGFIYSYKFNSHKIYYLLTFLLLIFFSCSYYYYLFLPYLKGLLYRLVFFINLFFSIALFVYIYLTIRKSIKIS